MVPTVQERVVDVRTMNPVIMSLESVLKDAAQATVVYIVLYVTINISVKIIF